MNVIEEVLTLAVSRLNAGELVAFPTETFYGLAANPSNRLGVATLLALKSRAATEGVPLIIDSGSRIEDWIDPSEPEFVRLKRKEVQERFWPGPLTLVFSTNKRARELFHEGLFGRELSLAMRWSSESLACELASRLGGAVTATSANPRGFTPPRTARDTRAYFPNVLVLEREELAEQPEDILPSTLLDVREYPFKILRQGAIAEAELREWLQ